MSKHPTLDALKALSAELDFTFVVEPASPAHREISVRVIRVLHGEGEWRVPCFDEYGDADHPSRVVLLHLILDACEFFEEAPDFETWRLDMGLKDDPISREMHDDLAAIVPEIRAVVGPDAAAIRPYAIEFNTELAKALRACTD